MNWSNWFRSFRKERIAHLLDIVRVRGFFTLESRFVDNLGTSDDSLSPNENISSVGPVISSRFISIGKRKKKSDIEICWTIYTDEANDRSIENHLIRTAIVVRRSTIRRFRNVHHRFEMLKRGKDFLSRISSITSSSYFGILKAEIESKQRVQRLNARIVNGNVEQRWKKRSRRKTFSFSFRSKFVLQHAMSVYVPRSTSASADGTAV